jgi:hypothetical protein
MQYNGYKWSDPFPRRYSTITTAVLTNGPPVSTHNVTGRNYQAATKNCHTNAYSRNLGKYLDESISGPCLSWVPP